MYPVQPNTQNGIVSAVQTQILNPSTATSPISQPQPQSNGYAPAYYPPANWVAPKSQQPQASVGAVNIQIYNPTATPNSNANSANPIPYYPPQYVPQQNSNSQNTAYNSAAPINNVDRNTISNSAVGTNQPDAINVNTAQNAQPAAQATTAETTTQSPAAKEIGSEAQRLDDKNQQPEKAEDKKADEKSKETKKHDPVPLSDDLIKTYENYLNNNNPKLRLNGIKEVLNRLKEDDSRKDNPALISLVNKALQDPKESVRVVALAALDAGYTYGDDYTVQLLKKMQESTAAYNEDAVTASQVLLKLAQNESKKDVINATQESGK